MIGMSQFILLKGLHFVKAINALHFHFKNKNSPLKGTRAKRDVSPGSSMSTGANSWLPRRSRRLMFEENVNGFMQLRVVSPRSW